MQLTIQVPDNLPQDMVQVEIKKLENKLAQAATMLNNRSKKNHPTKWALLAEKIRNSPIDLAGYSHQLKKDIREFRDHCEFSEIE